MPPYFNQVLAVILWFCTAGQVIAAPIQAITTDFADPSILFTGGTWYAYATGNYGKKVQIASASAFDGPWTVLSDDGLPDVPAWVVPDNPTGSFVWAPNVVQRSDGQFILYFSAARLDPPGGISGKSYHCVGAGISSSPTGPFTAQADPLACPIDQGGAIDPSGFVDSNGDVYVVYKVDGNNIGDGSWTCGQSQENPVPTPIMLQLLEGDWMTPSGDPVEILDRSDADGPLIEAPSLNLVNGIYYLYFSSNCYSTTLYDVSWATATSVSGPYTKAGAPNAPLLVTGDYGLTAPGGAAVTPDGTSMAFHSDLNGDDVSVREMWVASVTESGGDVTIN